MCVMQNKYGKNTKKYICLAIDKIIKGLLFTQLVLQITNTINLTLFINNNLQIDYYNKTYNKTKYPAKKIKSLMAKNKDKKTINKY